jgi:hypothetical protein
MTSDETGAGTGTDAPPRVVGETEQWKENGVRLRVIFYIAGTHVLAAFLWLMFYVGSHAHK